MFEIFVPVVLPFITNHDVEMVLGLVVEVVVILCVGREREVALQFLFVAIASIVESFRRAGVDVGHFLTFRYIGTECGVQAQVFESVHFVFNVGTSHESPAVGILVAEGIHGHGVAGSQLVAVVVEGIIYIGHTAGGLPLIVSAEVLSGRTVVIYALRGVHAHGGTQCTPAGIVCLGIHTLGIEVQGEVIFKERGVQVQ